MLHLVSNSKGYSACKRSLLPDDNVLFLGNGVYVAEETACEQTYAILQDVKARGLSLCAGVKGIDYDDFVQLVISTTSSVTWT
ncbi:MAG: sulfurtransferase complex subunit TusB [Gammaproteobacteria bacterium]|nr:sulfurtransferase complex subunit TusB [Gammaproteobacteria bacterium]MYC25819.1 sulfurtransferase complex subunit TusB [Gammaproteobacteria bacterium]